MQFEAPNGVNKLPESNYVTIYGFKMLLKGLLILWIEKLWIPLL